MLIVEDHSCLLPMAPQAKPVDHYHSGSRANGAELPSLDPCWLHVADELLWWRTDAEICLRLPLRLD